MKDLHPDRSAEETQAMYGHIPSIQDRAARARQAANALQGQKISDSASAPWVSTNETRHIPMHDTHTHDHAAHGQPDSADGIHQHEHSHSGDALHDHHPSTASTNQQPGRH